MKFADRTTVSFKAAMYLGVAALAVGMTSTAQAQAAEAKQIDIPAQSLANTLTQIGRQTSSEVVFQPADVRGHRAPAVRGALTADQALGAALRGSGLKARRTAQGAYVIEQDTASGNVATAASDEYRPDEIIVTAQKRAESVQDVPIAVTVLSQQDLNNQKIEGGPDIMRAVPNLTFSKSNFTGYNISIRGIGTKSISATSDPGVAVAFNNAGLIHNRFFEQEFFDLERVEVLRGPQGTLYGRNATGGVINLISAKPDLGGFSGSIKGEVGNYDSRRMTAMLNVPLIDDILGVRVAGSMTDRDGYDYNSVTKNRINGRDLWSLRTTIAFEPAPWFRANLIWERFNEDDNRSRTGKQLCHRDDGPTSVGNRDLATGQNLNFPSDVLLRQALFSQGCKPGSLYDDAAFGTPNGLALPFVVGANALAGIGANVGYRDDGNLRPLVPLLLVKDPYGGLMQSRDLHEIASIRDPVYRAKSDLFELNLDIDLTDALTFTSQTAYNDDSVYSFQDYNRFNSVPIFENTSGLKASGPGTSRANEPSRFVDFLPGGYYCDPQIGCSNTMAGFDISKAKSTQFSQEFRLQSSFDGPINFSVGANYTKFKTVNDYYVMFNVLSAIASIAPFNAGLGNYDVPFSPDICGRVTPGPVPTNDPSSTCPYIDPNPVESINGEGHNYFRSKNPYKLRSYALFGEAYWNITDDLKLTAGLRYTDDRKRFTPVPSQLLLARSINAGGAVNAGYPEKPDIVQNWGEFTGRLGVDWKPDLSFTDDSLLYAFYSRGYKGGGANPPSPGFATAQEMTDSLLATGTPPILIDYYTNIGALPTLKLTSVEYGPTFEPEYVNAFEIGAKNSFMNGALTLNATAFYYDYNGYQVSQIRDRTAVNENFDAKVWGAELEAVFAPTRNLRFNANVGYLKTRIADGESSIDIMNRTQGNPDYVLVKPWLQLPSNCVVPVGVAESWATANSIIGQYWTMCGGVRGYINQRGLSPIDPATNAPYDVTRYDGTNGTVNLNGGAGIRADLGGNELPNSPRWTVNMGAEYTIDFDQDWSATIRGDGYWQAKSWARVYNLNPYDRLRDWTNFNLTLRVNGPEGLAIEAYVKNVFNSTPITDAFLNSDDSGLTTNVFTLDPRIIGFSIAKKF